MSSLKMTFSLASLVLILGLVFVAAPAMAQELIDQVADFGAEGTVKPGGEDLIPALASTTNDNVTNISTANIPPGGYLILTKADSAATAFLGTTVGTGDDVEVMPWGQMPNLEDLFFEGGTILLKRTKFTAGNLIDHDGDDDGLMPNGQTPDGPAIADDGIKDIYQNGTPAAYEGDVADPTTAVTTANATDAQKASVKREIGIRDLVITEIMWARDRGMAGAAMDADLNHQWIEIYNPHDRAFSFRECRSAC